MVRQMWPLLLLLVATAVWTQSDTEIAKDEENVSKPCEKDADDCNDNEVCGAEAMCECKDDFKRAPTGRCEDRDNCVAFPHKCGEDKTCDPSKRTCICAKGLIEHEAGYCYDPNDCNDQDGDFCPEGTKCSEHTGKCTKLDRKKRETDPDDGHECTPNKKMYSPGTDKTGAGTVKVRKEVASAQIILSWSPINGFPVDHYEFKTLKDGKLAAIKGIVAAANSTKRAIPIGDGVHKDAQFVVYACGHPACTKGNTESVCALGAACDTQTSRCVCPPGYEGDGYNECRKIGTSQGSSGKGSSPNVDEEYEGKACEKSATNPCKDNEVCNDNGKCECKNGYVFVKQSGNCEDRENCVVFPNNCGSEKICDPASKRCVCPHGQEELDNGHCPKSADDNNGNDGNGDGSNGSSDKNKALNGGGESGSDANGGASRKSDRTCKEVKDCKDNEKCDEAGVCMCNDGYNFPPNSDKCEDRENCVAFPNNCGTEKECDQATRTCKCPNNQEELDDGHCPQTDDGTGSGNTGSNGGDKNGKNGGEGNDANGGASKKSDRTCKEVKDCKDNEKCDEAGVCMCKDGYNYPPNSDKCEDRENCVAFPNNCGTEKECDQATRTCKCPNNQEELDDGHCPQTDDGTGSGNTGSNGGDKNGKNGGEGGSDANGGASKKSDRTCKEVKDCKDNEKCDEAGVCMCKDGYNYPPNSDKCEDRENCVAFPNNCGTEKECDQATRTCKCSNNQEELDDGHCPQKDGTGSDNAGSNGGDRNGKGGGEGGSDGGASNKSNRKCKGVDDCKDNEKCDNGGVCICKDGYNYPPNSDKCEDRENCVAFPNNCGTEKECDQATRTCKCPNNQEELDDGHCPQTDSGTGSGNDGSNGGDKNGKNGGEGGSDANGGASKKSDRTCKEVTDCKDNEKCDEGKVCICKDGYNYPPNSDKCEDRENCVAFPNNCGTEKVCDQDTRTCKCPNNEEELADGHCPNSKNDNDDNIWKGNDNGSKGSKPCNKDADDCNDNEVCGAEKLCECKDGFKRAQSGRCEDRDNCVAFPNNCGQDKTCDPSTGTCTCAKGLTEHEEEGYCYDPNDCNDQDDEDFCPEGTECSEDTGKCVKPEEEDTGSKKKCSAAGETEGCGDNEICDENKECICRDGFLKTASGQCADREDCIAFPNKCGTDRTCDPASKTCHCNEGLTEHEEEGYCYDPNDCNDQEDEDFCPEGTECSEDTGKCVKPKDTRCTVGQTEGCDDNEICDEHRKCICKDGYLKTASGRCSDREDCIAFPNKCGTDRTCEPATKTCICNEGLTEHEDGYCYDPNDCNDQEEDFCPENSECDEDGTKCKCSAGYSGSPDACTSIDDCTAFEGVCGEAASCNSTVKRCACAKDYSGDGKVCIHKDDCTAKDNAKCGAHATCDPTSKRCHCDSGYIGKPNACKDAGDCVENPSACGDNEQCDKKTKNCECKDGYLRLALGCADREDCTLFPNRCGTEKTCDKETKQCVCPEGLLEHEEGYCYEKDDCTVHEDDDEVFCPANSVCDDDTARCQCAEGYRKTATDSSCVKIDNCVHFSDACDGDGNSECDTGAKECVCKPGFKLNKDKRCVPEDDCLAFKKVCAPQVASCDAATRKCVCDPGFVGDGKKCVNVDNCVANKGICDAKATCGEDTKRCVCQDGTVGDGRKCSDPNDCQVFPGICDPNAECESESKRCVCKEGFSGNGTYCVSFDDCTVQRKESICHEHATCNQETKRCACNEGYKGDGRSCFSVHNCVVNEGICPDTAYCDPNSRRCVCKKGYVGDGRQCVDKDDCVANNNTKGFCDEHAVCNAKSRRCECSSDYVGDGRSNCFHKDDCTKFKGLCGENSVCDPKSKRCVCSEGFGLYKGKCVSIHNCVAFPTDACPSNSACNKKAESCECRDGYFGDGRLCVEVDDCIANKNLKCGEKSKCNQNTRHCECMAGFEKQGVACVNAGDCVTFSGICSYKGTTCDTKKRRCVCMEGFTEYESECTNENNCAAFKDICDKNAHCDDETQRCVCNDGFIGDGRTCISSQDCVLRLHECGRHARCNVTTHRCECKLGYERKGEKAACQKSKDCVLFKGICTKNGTACNEKSRRCACVKGFTKRGQDCINNDNCDVFPNVCSRDGHCDEKTKRCVCNDHYVGDGKKCVGADDCVENEGLDCGENAVCSQATQRCECKVGFDRRDFECITQKDCVAFPKACSVGHRKCDKQSRRCTCIKDYVQDDQNSNVCFHKHNCLRKPQLCAGDGNICHPFLERCICYIGYKKDPSSSGYPPKCLSECASGDIDGCQNGGTCDSYYIGDEKAYKCLCKKGFQGKNCETPPEKADPLDCVANTKLCGENGECGSDKSCSCNTGYYQLLIEHADDSISVKCNPSPEDCVSSGKGICDADASCDSKTRRCTCAEGFEGDGLKCQKKQKPPSVCEPNPCQANAICDVLDDGISYSCRCKDGYIGNSEYCTIAEPCEDDGVCPEDSQCLKNPLNVKCSKAPCYYCLCPFGFTGPLCDKLIVGVDVFLVLVPVVVEEPKEPEGDQPREVTLTWEPVDNVDHYLIYQRTPSGQFVEIAELPASTHKYFVTIPADVKSVKNHFMVKAVKKPEIIKVSTEHSEDAESFITLTWSAAPDTKSYVVEQMFGGNWVIVARLPPDITSYRVKLPKEATDNLAEHVRITATKDRDQNAGRILDGWKARGDQASFTLSWPPVANVDYYLVQQRKNGRWVTIKGVPGDRTSVKLQKQDNADINKDYRVQYVLKPKQELIWISTPVPVDVALELTPENDFVVLQWKVPVVKQPKNKELTGYRVYFAYNPDDLTTPRGQTIDVEPKANEITLNQLKPGTRVYVMVSPQYAKTGDDDKTPSHTLLKPITPTVSQEKGEKEEDEVAAPTLVNLHLKWNQPETSRPIHHYLVTLTNPERPLWRRTYIVPAEKRTLMTESLPADVSYVVNVQAVPDSKPLVEETPEYIPATVHIATRFIPVKVNDEQKAVNVIFPTIDLEDQSQFEYVILVRNAEDDGYKQLTSVPSVQTDGYRFVSVDIPLEKLTPEKPNSIIVMTKPKDKQGLFYPVGPVIVTDAAQVTDYSFELEWSVPEDTEINSASLFVVSLIPEGGPSKDFSFSGSQDGATFGKVRPGTVYDIQVKLLPNPPPKDPSLIRPIPSEYKLITTFEPADSTVKLQWPAVDKATTYQVIYFNSPDEEKSKNATENQVELTDIDTEEPMRVIVLAYDQDGLIGTAGPLTILATEKAISRQITLTWEKPRFPVKKYILKIIGAENSFGKQLEIAGDAKEITMDLPNDEKLQLILEAIPEPVELWPKPTKTRQTTLFTPKGESVSVKWTLPQKPDITHQIVEYRRSVNDEWKMVEAHLPSTATAVEVQYLKPNVPIELRVTVVTPYGRYEVPVEFLDPSEVEDVQIVLEWEKDPSVPVADYTIRIVPTADPKETVNIFKLPPTQTAITVDHKPGLFASESVQFEIEANVKKPSFGLSKPKPKTPKEKGDTSGKIFRLPNEFLKSKPTICVRYQELRPPKSISTTARVRGSNVTFNIPPYEGASIGAYIVLYRPAEATTWSGAVKVPVSDQNKDAEGNTPVTIRGLDARKKYTFSVMVVPKSAPSDAKSGDFDASVPHNQPVFIKYREEVLGYMELQVEVQDVHPRPDYVELIARGLPDNPAIKKGKEPEENAHEKVVICSLPPQYKDSDRQTTTPQNPKIRYVDPAKPLRILVQPRKKPAEPDQDTEDYISMNYNNHISATIGESGQISLRWAPLEQVPVDYYIISYRREPLTEWHTLPYKFLPTTNRMTLDKLKANASYNFKVEAHLTNSDDTHITVPLTVQKTPSGTYSIHLEWNKLSADYYEVELTSDKDRSSSVIVRASGTSDNVNINKMDVGHLYQMVIRAVPKSATGSSDEYDIPQYEIGRIPMKVRPFTEVKPLKDALTVLWRLTPKESEKEQSVEIRPISHPTWQQIYTISPAKEDKNDKPFSLTIETVPGETYQIRIVDKESGDLIESPVTVKPKDSRSVTLVLNWKQLESLPVSYYQLKLQADGAPTATLSIPSDQEKAYVSVVPGKFYAPKLYAYLDTIEDEKPASNSTNNQADQGLQISPPIPASPALPVTIVEQTISVQPTSSSVAVAWKPLPTLAAGFYVVEIRTADQPVWKMVEVVPAYRDSATVNVANPKQLVKLRVRAVPVAKRIIGIFTPSPKDGSTSADVEWKHAPQKFAYYIIEQKIGDDYVPIAVKGKDDNKLTVTSVDKNTKYTIRVSGVPHLFTRSPKLPTVEGAKREKILVEVEKPKLIDVVEYEYTFGSQTGKVEGSTSVIEIPITSESDEGTEQVIVMAIDSEGKKYDVEINVKPVYKAADGEEPPRITVIFDASTEPESTESENSESSEKAEPNSADSVIVTVYDPENEDNSFIFVATKKQPTFTIHNLRPNTHFVYSEKRLTLKTKEISVENYISQLIPEELLVPVKDVYLKDKSLPHSFELKWELLDEEKTSVAHYEVIVTTESPKKAPKITYIRLAAEEGKAVIDHPSAKDDETVTYKVTAKPFYSVKPKLPGNADFFDIETTLVPLSSSVDLSWPPLDNDKVQYYVLQVKKSDADEYVTISVIPKEKHSAKLNDLIPNKPIIIRLKAVPAKEPSGEKEEKKEEHDEVEKTSIPIHIHLTSLKQIVQSTTAVKVISKPEAKKDSYKSYVVVTKESKGSPKVISGSTDIDQDKPGIIEVKIPNADIRPTCVDLYVRNVRQNEWVVPPEPSVIPKISISEMYTKAPEVSSDDEVETIQIVPHRDNLIKVHKGGSESDETEKEPEPEPLSPEPEPLSSSEEVTERPDTIKIIEEKPKPTTTAVLPTKVPPTTNNIFVYSSVRSRNGKMRVSWKARKVRTGQTILRYVILQKPRGSSDDDWVRRTQVAFRRRQRHYLAYIGKPKDMTLRKFRKLEFRVVAQVQRHSSEPGPFLSQKFPQKDEPVVPILVKEKTSQQPQGAGDDAGGYVNVKRLNVKNRRGKHTLKWRTPKKAEQGNKIVAYLVERRPKGSSDAFEFVQVVRAKTPNGRRFVRLSHGAKFPKPDGDVEYRVRGLLLSNDGAFETQQRDVIALPTRKTRRSVGLKWKTPKLANNEFIQRFQLEMSDNEFKTFEPLNLRRIPQPVQGRNAAYHLRVAISHVPQEKKRIFGKLQFRVRAIVVSLKNTNTELKVSPKLPEEKQPTSPILVKERIPQQPQVAGDDASGYVNVKPQTVKNRQGTYSVKWRTPGKAEQGDKIVAYLVERRPKGSSDAFEFVQVVRAKIPMGRRFWRRQHEAWVPKPEGDVEYRVRGILRSNDGALEIQPRDVKVVPTRKSRRSVVLKWETPKLANNEFIRRFKLEISDNAFETFKLLKLRSIPQPHQRGNAGYTFRLSSSKVPRRYKRIFAKLQFRVYAIVGSLKNVNAEPANDKGQPQIEAALENPTNLPKPGPFVPAKVVEKERTQGDDSKQHGSIDVITKVKQLRTQMSVRIRQHPGGRVKLTWNVPSKEDSIPITSFFLRAKTADEHSYTTLAELPPNDRSVIVDQLKPNKKYSFKLEARPRYTLAHAKITRTNPALITWTPPQHLPEGVEVTGYDVLTKSDGEDAYQSRSGFITERSYKLQVPEGRTDIQVKVNLVQTSVKPRKDKPKETTCGVYSCRKTECLLSVGGKFHCSCDYQGFPNHLQGMHCDQPICPHDKSTWEQLHSSQAAKVKLVEEVFVQLSDVSADDCFSMCHSNQTCAKSVVVGGQHCYLQFTGSAENFYGCKKTNKLLHDCAAGDCKVVQRKCSGQCSKAFTLDWFWQHYACKQENTRLLKKYKCN